MTFLFIILILMWNQHPVCWHRGFYSDFFNLFSARPCCYFKRTLCKIWSTSWGKCNFYSSCYYKIRFNSLIKGILMQKYQQLRIKILGDCYYCISGAPVERPDHAVLCVHMGLSMVKAIKWVKSIRTSNIFVPILELRI